ncbi:MAG: hypothetical protein ACK5LK_00775 [Chthoniobacterales bacterium]
MSWHLIATKRSSKRSSRSIRFAASVVVFVTLFACFLASDHCLVAAFSATECCEHEGPASKQPANPLGSKMLCCDIVQGVPGAVAKAPITDFTFLKTICFSEISDLPLEPVDTENLVNFTSGESPPPGASFALLFSSRDLLAHAPPILAA